MCTSSMSEEPTGLPLTTRWIKGLLTVTVSQHDAGVLPPQLQGHPLQVTLGCGLLDELAHLWYTANH